MAHEDCSSAARILVATFLMGYGLSRFIIEFAREPDSHLGLYDFGLWQASQGQLLSLPMVAIGFICAYHYQEVTTKRMTPLQPILTEKIATSGPLSVSAYMQACLLDETHGYYAHTPVFGAEGDFITAPEISQLFGEMLGAFSICISFLHRKMPSILRQARMARLPVICHEPIRLSPLPFITPRLFA